MVRYVLPATAAVYSSFYGVKAVFTFKRMRLERSVSDLIADLDDADSAIRKNISYLREENFLRGLAKDKWYVCGPLAPMSDRSILFFDFSLQREQWWHSSKVPGIDDQIDSVDL